MATQAKPPSSSPANGRPANSRISSTSGGKARKKSTQAISGQRTSGMLHARQQRQDQPAEQAERHHEQRQQHGVPQPGQHDRPGGGDDLAG